jgi:hypothetical protein
MWGGGFLKQASETSKQNHNLLRKTKDKRSVHTLPLSIRGQVETKRMSDSERQEFLLALKEDNKRDFKKKLILFSIITLIITVIAVMILN